MVETKRNQIEITTNNFYIAGLARLPVSTA